MRDRERESREGGRRERERERRRWGGRERECKGMTHTKQETSRQDEYIDVDKNIKHTTREKTYIKTIQRPASTCLTASHSETNAENPIMALPDTLVCLNNNGQCIQDRTQSP